MYNRSIKTKGEDMEYKNNNDIRAALKAAAAIQGASLADIARGMDIAPQSLQDMLRKKHIGFDDIARAAAVVGCKLLFEIVPETSPTPGDTITQ